MAKPRDMKICHEVRNSNIWHNVLNVKISAIRRDPHLELSLRVLNISREGKVVRILYLGPSIDFMKR